MNRALIVLFVAIISLPVAATIAGVDGGDREAENRELARFPHWDGSWASAQAYPGAFVAWFEDHFAFRATLVRWNAETHLLGLAVSPFPATVVKGEGPWLYYGEDFAVEDYAHAQPLAADDIAQWREAIVRARDWLRRRGIAYVFTIAPDKHVVYPEHMPRTIRVAGGVSRTDQVYAALAGTGVAAVDLRPALMAAKPRERLYFLTDTHWNDRGALLAYQQIIEAVRAQVPSTPPAWSRDDFRADDERVSGKDLAGMLGLNAVLNEVDLRLIPIRPRRARVVSPPGAEPMAEVGALTTEVADPSLPKAVIFRDSFTSRLVPFLSEHFSRAVYLWQNDFDADVVVKERPDVVIEQIVGRHLYSFIPSPSLVPR